MHAALFGPLGLYDGYGVFENPVAAAQYAQDMGFPSFSITLTNAPVNNGNDPDN